MLQDALLALEPQLGPPESEPVPLEGGITNRNYRVRFSGRDCVVRLPGKNTELLGIDRVAERAATVAAAAIGVGPDVMAFEPVRGCLVTGFIDARPVPADEPARRSSAAARSRRHTRRCARPRGWAGMHWSPAIGAEHAACREAAALFDETSFAKLEVSGPGAAELLERRCDNRVARDVGRIAYTQMLNSRGGIECDFTVARLAEDRFGIVTGTAFGRHDLGWIARHAGDGVRVEDVTSRWACAGLWGPKARDVLAAACTDDLSFPYTRWRELTVGDVPVRALRVTYVGELGWELYCPMEYGAALWRTLWEAGPPARARGRRLPRDRLAAAREGLPRVGGRHHARRHAVRGRRRLLRAGRQGLPREGRARRVTRPPAVLLVLQDPRSVALGNEPVQVGSDWPAG